VLSVQRVAELQRVDHVWLDIVDVEEWGLVIEIGRRKSPEIWRLDHDLPDFYFYRVHFEQLHDRSVDRNLRGLQKIKTVLSGGVAVRDAIIA
jgi:hypothetical protein